MKRSYYSESLLLGRKQEAEKRWTLRRYRTCSNPYYCDKWVERRSSWGRMVMTTCVQAYREAVLYRLRLSLKLPTVAVCAARSNLGTMVHNTTQHMILMIMSWISALQAAAAAHILIWFRHSLGGPYPEK
jgi:hypothetical protein